MKLFLDTADVSQIREACSWGVISGVTTNPTLVSKQKNMDFKELVKEICEIVDGPVSAEVVSLDVDGMVKEAMEFSKIDPRVVIKIPMTKEGMSATKRLSSEGIRVNVTLVFSAAQAILAAEAGATYISLFMGRLDDVGEDSIAVLENIVAMKENYGFESQILAASIRHPYHVVQAALVGADVATVPFAVLEKLFNHPLTDVGIKRFLEDWNRYRNRG
ncbi:MAG: fructose-6-phosphate aldolase [Synergistetes bacterium]|nr:fructose-6-phosphate aldolase [Synergistota bacterium]